VGVFLLRRVADFRLSLERVRDVAALVVYAGMASTAIAATIGVASLWSAGLVGHGEVVTTWRVWWLGDLGGDLVVAPALLIFQAVHRSVSDPVAIGISSATLFLLVVTRMAGLLRQVQVQAVQLRNLARVDELTGLPNRRAWFGELPLALERARRDGRPTSVAILDLDHFKKFNDTYGHPAGDQLLRGAANGWVTKLRTVDTLGRYGGEEFVALLPAADGTEAATVIDRLREATPSGQTFSCGVATWDGQESVEDLIARADKALYAAKAGGRNRTVVHGEEPSLAGTGA